MNTRLEIIPRSAAGLSEDALNALELQLEALIGLCRRDGRGTARLALSCVSALTADDVGEAGVQGFLCCLMGGRAWAAVSGELDAAKYAAGRFLALAAEAGLLDRGLLTAALDRIECFSGAEELRQFLREQRRAAPSCAAAVRPVQTALEGLGLPNGAKLTYFEFIRAVAGHRDAYRALLGGRRLARVPEGHLLPLAGIELYQRLSAVGDGELQVLAARTGNSPQGLRESLVARLILRQLPDVDVPLRYADLLSELAFCLRAAEAEGLLVPAGTEPEEPSLPWEAQVFRALSRTRGGAFCGSGSGSGSGRFGSGSGRLGLGSGRYGSGSGLGSGSGRYGSSGSAGCAMGVFEGGGLSGDGFGGVYGLELIDAPLGVEQVLDMLLKGELAL